MRSKHAIMAMLDFESASLRARTCWHVLIALTLAVMLFGLSALPASAQQTTTLPGGKIAGIVYDDNNGNGVRDAGEGGIPNYSVLVSRELPGDDFSDIVTTDANGAYIFYPNAYLLITVPGSTPYKVRPLIPFGWVSKPAEAEVQVFTNQTTNADFGISLPVQVYMPRISNYAVAR